MAESVPSIQKAAVYQKPNGPINFTTVPVAEPSFDEVLVKILFSGVCHSDLHCWKGELPTELPLKYPLIGGHEGAGTIAKVGSHVTNFKPGDRVGVKWMNSLCETCEFCLKGFESSCLNPLYTGFYCNGTFQQYALIKARETIRIPDGIKLEEAAPIFCAGMTVYRGLLESNLKAGETIAIVGCGGGLGSLAVQYAKAMGYIVLGIDDVHKKQKCEQLGVDIFVDTSNPAEIPQKIIDLTDGGAHTVFNVAASTAAIEASLLYVRRRGTVLMIAIPESYIKMDMFSSVMRTITIKTSLVGNRQDAIEALEFVARGQVKVPVELYRLEDLTEIFGKMEKGQIVGRAVIDLWK